MDDVLAEVDRLDDVPLDEHLAAFERAHDALRLRPGRRPGRAGLAGVAASPQARRRAGTSRSGPVPRPRRRADRRRPRECVGCHRHQARHCRDHRRRAGGGRRPGNPRGAGVRLARWAQAGRCAGGVPARGAGRRGPALPRCRRLDRWLHRRAAAPRRPRGGGSRRRLRATGLAAPAGRPGAGARPDQRPRPRPRDDRGPGRSRGRRPLVHLADPRTRRADRGDEPGRRPGADGEAAVRGGQAEGGQGRCGARSGTARRGGRDGGRRGGRPWLGCAGRDGQPATGPVWQRRVLPVAAPRAERGGPGGDRGCGVGRTPGGAQ